jgi:hypothetical protein
MENFRHFMLGLWVTLLIAGIINGGTVFLPTLFILINLFQLDYLEASIEQRSFRIWRLEMYIQKRSGVLPFYHTMDCPLGCKLYSFGPIGFTWMSGVCLEGFMKDEKCE